MLNATCLRLDGKSTPSGGADGAAVPDPPAAAAAANPSTFAPALPCGGVGCFLSTPPTPPPASAAAGEDGALLLLPPGALRLARLRDRRLLTTQPAGLLLLLLEGGDRLLSAWPGSVVSAARRRADHKQHALCAVLQRCVLLLQLCVFSWPNLAQFASTTAQQAGARFYHTHAFTHAVHTHLAAPGVCPGCRALVRTS